MKVIKAIGLVMIVLFAVTLSKSFGQGRLDQRTQAKEVAELKEVSALTKLVEASNLDGTKKIIGTSELKEGMVKYMFTVVDTKNNKRTVLYETLVDKGASLTIPFNSWSSDDKYVFLQANQLGGKTYFVFRADGESFGDGARYLDVQDYWKKTKNSKVVDNITGWAGPDLLVTHATNPDGSESFSYWFVVSTRSFMQVREL